VIPGTRRPLTIAAVGLALAAATLAAVTFVPRAPTDSDYFGPNTPTWVRVPTTLGDPVYVGVLVINALPGDAIELESLAFERVEGDATAEPLLRILGEEAQTLGGIAASNLPATFDLSTYRPLPGFRFTDLDGPVELSVRIEGPTPIHGFDGLWLRFTRKGGSTPVEDWLPMRASICTGTTLDEAVERCRPIESQMHSFGL
jgi:hypothetical protein